jgi:hypothetical protein
LALALTALDAVQLGPQCGGDTADSMTGIFDFVQQSPKFIATW